MFKIYEPDTKFNKIYAFIGNTVTIGTGIIGFISWIAKKVLQEISSFPPLVINILSGTFYGCIAIFIISMFLFICKLVYVSIKTKAQAFYTQRKLTEFIHKNLIHDIRNNIVELETLSNKINKFSSNNNIDAITECYNTELDRLKRNLKQYINSLAEYLSKYRQSIISVCIKTFKKRDRNRIQFQSEEIITLARSSNTASIRNTNDKTYVGQNTDFNNLCDGKILFFASSNLHKVKESGLYLNDSKDWEMKYTSTLVTPIRYQNNSSEREHSKNIKSDVIGFLCIDSQDEIKEWENNDSFELQLLAIFSDILYVYIKEFYQCFEDIGYDI